MPPPKMQTMSTPETRAEFELRLNHLREAIGNGNLHILPNMVEGLLKIRLLPNGRLDFLSVDEMARLQANTLVQFADFRGTLSATDEQAPGGD
jgi:hypothetical protein